MRKGLLALVLALGTVWVHGEKVHGEGMARRLVVADGKAPVVYVLDLEEGKEVARFSVPSLARLYPLPGGQYALAVHRDSGHLSFIWSGLRLVNHGDHQDLRLEAPYVAATLATGPKPTHAFAHGHHLAVFHDGDGTVALFDLRRLGLDWRYRQVATGRPDHGALALLGERLLVGGLESGRVEVYTLEGQKALTLPEACPRLHGEAVLEGVAVFGCQDGVLLVEGVGQGVRARKLPNPPRSPEGARVGTLVALEEAGVFVGNFGQGLAVIRLGEGLKPLPLPARPLRFLAEEGKGVLVLTAEGRLHRVDPLKGEVGPGFPVATPPAQGAPSPALAVGHGVAYVADPAQGAVVEVDLEGFQVKRRLPVGGAPAALALLEVEGMEH
ncbi:hypothetical protein [Thermus sp.]|uniref:hypothetical protein n=1 Tax=Thermus sp. TaxID=275 RepID=UPI00307F2B85